MGADTIYSWETLPEYVATQEYSRCLGRILASLPPLLARRATTPAIWLGAGIAAANADLPPGEELPPDERARFRARSLDGIRTSLRRLHRFRLGDRPEIRRALDLLDQVEQWMNAPRAAGTRTH